MVEELTPQQKWNRRNADKMRQATRKWREKNRDKARAYARDWKKRNKARHAEHTQRRKARKLNQTPIGADFIEIAKFYLEAQRLTLLTGIPHQVDHIKPLSKGGLHHQDNLQVITAEQNRLKGATYEIDK